MATFSTEFFEPSYWERIPLSQLKEDIRTLNIPSRGIFKAELIQKILGHLGPSRPIQVPPGKRDDRLGDFLEVIGPRRMATMVDSSILMNIEAVTVDHPRMMAYLESHIKTYGRYSLTDIIPFLRIPPSTGDDSNPFEDYTNTLDWSQDRIIEVLQRWWATGDDKVLNTFPSFRGSTGADLVYDLGVTPNPSGGYPRVVYTYGTLTLSTMPFGLRPSHKSNHLILIDGVPLKTYNAFIAVIEDSDCLEAWKYLLVKHPNLGLNSTLRTPATNLVSVVRRLLPEATPETFRHYLVSLNRLPRLTPGKRLVLERYLEARPEVKARLLPPRSDFDSLEERLETEDLAALPTELRRPWTPSKSDDPHRFISQTTATAIYKELGLDYPEGVDPREAIKRIDELFPAWGTDILEIALNFKGLQSLSPGALGYYAAHLGVNIDDEIIKLPLVHALAQLREFWSTIPISKAEAQPLTLEVKNAYLSSIGNDPFRIDFLCQRLGFYLGIPHLNLLTGKDIRQIFEAGYRDFIEIPPNVVARDQIYVGLSDVQRELLSQLYSFKREENHAFQFAWLKSPHPLEAYILRLQAENLETLIANLGIVVPDYLSRMYYVRDAIPHLKGLFERKANAIMVLPREMSQLTDDEIIRALGVILGYSSRESLVRNAEAFYSHQPTFFVPLIRRPRNIRLVTDPLDEETPLNPEAFVIAYGSRSPVDEKTEDYRAYTPEEIIQANTLSQGESGAILSFRLYLSVDPVTFQEVSTQDVKALRDLLLVVRRWDPMTGPLLRVINQYVKSLEGLSVYDRELIKVFSALEDREKLKAVLLALFKLGMTFRQWLGPGHPYPLRAQETRRPGFDPSLDTREAIEKLMSHLLALPRATSRFFGHLRLVEHRDRAIIQYTEMSYDRKIYRSIAELLDAVLKERFCIRVASKYLIGTGHYYLNLLFREPIRGYNPKDLELIQ